jgi:Right handed beta helix region
MHICHKSAVTEAVSGRGCAYRSDVLYGVPSDGCACGRLEATVMYGLRKHTEDGGLVSDRREFIALLGGALAAWPSAARAQQRMRRIADSTSTGFANAPGFPGSLTPWPGGAFTNGSTYSFFDFDQGNGGTVISADNITFIGCRFQSNQLDDNNVAITGTNVTLSYCSITPRTALVTSPPNAAWPSAGAGTDVDSVSGNVDSYMIGGTRGYQYGIKMFGSGTTTIDHCDIWGFGNAITFFSGSSSTMIINRCWIHDAANPSPKGYHTDGVGYLDGGSAPSNITVSNCIIASIGNTNGIAFQAATSAYSNITVSDCYLSGFAFCVDFCHNTPGNNNLSFTNNVFGSDLRWHYGALYNDFTAQFSSGSPTNQWSGNTFHVLSGTTPAPTSGLKWNNSQNGFFLWPDSTLHSTDYVHGH